MSYNSDFKTLGLSPEASWDEVKTAFRRLARVYHPDVAGPEAAGKFVEITSAYMTLKASISPGASCGVCRRVEKRRERSSLAVRCGFFMKSVWRRLFGSEVGRVDDVREEEIPPVRIRFIGSVISQAESQLSSLLSQRSELRMRNRTDAILKRLKSRHPSVVLLALRRMSPKDVTDEIRRALVEHVKTNVPTSEVLERLFSLFQSSSLSIDFARAVILHAADFSREDAHIALRWFKRNKATRDCYSAFLSHPSDSVVASVLSAWPPSYDIPNVLQVSDLLRKNDETILVPLLRLLKRKRVPVGAIPHIVRLSRTHPSPSVRVWASSIVREQNLG